MTGATMSFGTFALAFFGLAASMNVSVAEAPRCGLNTGKPATDAPIEIGAIVSRTGPGDVSAGPRATKAYFDCVNANGGVNGRPIHYTIVDDNGQPDRAVEVAAKLLTGQKVVGLVGSSSFVDCTINAPLYNERDVMAIASYGLARECYFSKNIAPFSEGPRLSLLGRRRIC
jgi:branched-chain amino acid transport system substrate-binding protein